VERAIARQQWTYWKERKMNCQKCGFQISDSAVFCEKCGAKQEKAPQTKICSNPDCRNEMPADMIFCDKCGTRYAAPIAEPKPHPAEEAVMKTGEKAKSGKAQEKARIKADKKLERAIARRHARRRFKLFLLFMGGLGVFGVCVYGMTQAGGSGFAGIIGLLLAGVLCFAPFVHYKRKW
jgi:hypothetical protein